MPLPSAPTRRRARGAQMPPAIAANSKPLAPTPALADHHVGNNLVKAHNDGPSEVEMDAPADVVEHGGSGEATAARDVDEEAEREQDAAEAGVIEMKHERNASRDEAEEMQPAREDEALPMESQPTAKDEEADQHSREPAEQPESDALHGHSENDGHADDTPAKSSSLLSKMGGAMLSLVGQSHKAENDPHADDRRLSAPGEYPLSEVQSPVEELSPESGLDGHLRESDTVPHNVSKVEERSLGALQDAHTSEVHDLERENDGLDRSRDVPEEHESSDVDAHPLTPREDELQESPSTKDLGGQVDNISDTIPCTETLEDPTTQTTNTHPHPDEGHFDMSGAAAIPGTMTHGMDEPERLVTVDEARAHLTGDNVETPMEPETPLSKELGPTGQPDLPTGPEHNVSQAAEPVDHDSEALESESAPHETDSSDAAGQSVPDEEDMQPSQGLELGSRESSSLPERHKQTTPTEKATSPIEASSPTIAASDDDGGGHSKSDYEAMEFQHSALEGMEPLQGTDHHDAAESSHEALASGDQDSESEAEAIAEHSQRPLDADGLDSQLGDVTPPDHESGLADPTPQNDFSRTEMGSEASAPLWNKLEAGGSPHIEYVSEGEDTTTTQADIPEHLQDPAASDEPRASLDLSVPEIGASLGEPIDIHETGDSVKFQDARLAAADPGLHEGKDETPQPANEIKESQSDNQPATTDTDSQAFITPLQSAGVRSPLKFDERGATLADELGYAEAGEDGHQVWGDESAATVQGQDDLFDDDYSNDSHGSNEQAEQEAADDLYEYEYEGEEEDDDGEPIKEQVVTHQEDPMDDDVPRTAVIASNPAATASFVSDSGYLSEAPAGSLTADESTETLSSHHHEPSTPQLQPVAGSESHPETTSPLSLRHTSPSSTFRGLAERRHAPKAAAAAAAAATRPVPPPPRHGGGPPSDAADSPILPRDGPHDPWHARPASVPQSLHSQTTLSSSPSSPVHAALPIDNHEPVIRDSYPSASHHSYLAGLAAAGGRPRNDSLLSQSDYEAFAAAAERKSPLATKWAARRDSAANITPPPGGSSNSARNLVATSSPSSLFQKMRSIFEPPGAAGGGGGGAGGGATTPPRSRPVSGVWYNIQGTGGSPGRKAGGGHADENDAA